MEGDNFKCKVSSVYNNNTIENGKDFMFDNEEDTCWSSNQGKLQFVLIAYEVLKDIKEISLRSQGGFCPKVILNFNFYEVDVLYSENDEFSAKTPDLKFYKTIFFDNSNDNQVK